MEEKVINELKKLNENLELIRFSFNEYRSQNGLASLIVDLELAIKKLCECIQELSLKE